MTEDKSIDEAMKDVADLAFALIRELEMLITLPSKVTKANLAKALYDFTRAIANDSVTGHQTALYSTVVAASDPSNPPAGVTTEQAQAGREDLGRLVRMLLKIEEETRGAA